METGFFTPKAIAKRLLRAVIVIYVVLFAIQRYLIFPAYMANIAGGVLKTPADYGLSDFTEIALTTSDNIHTLGWSHAPEGDKPVILYFHGNASNVASRGQRYLHFIKEGYGIFALSYRGYGRSEGSPSEDGLYNDARAAMDWLNRHYDHPRIILYGESLGTGVAAEMAKEYKVTGLVLQSAYTSMPDVAADTYWFLPGTHMLVRDQFNTLSKLRDIHCPVLILHGDHDNVIPLAHGQALAKAANEPKHFVTVAGAGHMNIPDELIIKEMNNIFGNLEK